MTRVKNNDMIWYRKTNIESGTCVADVPTVRVQGKWGGITAWCNDIHNRPFRATTYTIAPSVQRHTQSPLPSKKTTPPKNEQKLIKYNQQKQTRLTVNFLFSRMR